MSSDTLPRLHNAMWPGLVGKVNGQKFEGIDYFLFLPHTDPNARDDELKGIADLIQGYGFNVGSLVAPVWGGTVGDTAMGDAAAREKFLDAVRMACRIAGVFNEHGVRKYGVIRIDSAEFGVEKWREDPKANTAKIAETFREAAKVAADHGERLAAEGEICWAGLHSWKDTLDLLEAVGMPETLGFQADMAHTFLYLMGYNAPRWCSLAIRKRSSTPPTKRWSTSCGPGLSTSTWRRTTARYTALVRTTRRASTAQPTTPTASSTSSAAQVTGLRTPRRAASSTSAGTGACSPTRSSKHRIRGTRSSM